MQIFFKTLTGRTITITTDGSINDVKERIHDKTNIKPNQQHLYYAGKPLQDGRSLADLNVQNESTLEMVIPLPGGSLSDYGFTSFPVNLAVSAEY
jgi:hypothetical protein